MKATPPNTPGFVGYLLAFAVGFVVFALLTAPLADPARVDAFDTLGLFVYMNLFTLGIPLMIAIVAVLIANAALRRHESQSTHVIAAAAVSFAFAMLLALFTEQWVDKVVLLFFLPAAMAIGRASVIPLVRRRRAGSRPS